MPARVNKPVPVLRIVAARPPAFKILPPIRESPPPSNVATLVAPFSVEFQKSPTKVTSPVAVLFSLMSRTLAEAAPQALNVMP